MDMIERAAKTIYEERAAVPPGDAAKWDDATEETREWIRGHVRAALLAALDPEDEALAAILGAPVKVRVFTRRNKMHDERQWEVVHDIDPDGPISDDSYRVIGRFETDKQATEFAETTQRGLEARERIAALRASIAQGGNAP